LLCTQQNGKLQFFPQRQWIAGKSFHAYTVFLCFNWHIIWSNYLRTSNLYSRFSTFACLAPRSCPYTESSFPTTFLA
jgi:hypothetical protein